MRLVTGQNTTFDNISMDIFRHGRNGMYKYAINMMKFGIEMRRYKQGNQYYSRGDGIYSKGKMDYRPGNIQQIQKDVIVYKTRIKDK